MKNYIFITDSSKQLYEAFKANLNLINVETIPVEIASNIKHVELYSKNTTMCKAIISFPKELEVNEVLSKISDNSVQYKLYYNILEFEVGEHSLLFSCDCFIQLVQVMQLFIKDILPYNPSISLFINYVVNPYNNNRQEDILYSCYPLAALSEVNFAITSGLIIINRPFESYDTLLLAMIFKTLHESRGLIQLTYASELDLETYFSDKILPAIEKYYGQSLNLEELQKYIDTFDASGEVANESE